MNINWNKEETTKAVYTSLVVFTCIIFSKIVFNLDDFVAYISKLASVFTPFAVGGCIAYLLNFILVFYEKNLKKIPISLGKKGYRSLSTILTYLTAFITIYSFIYFILPQVSSSVSGLMNDIPLYVENASKFLSDTMTKLNISPDVYAFALDKWNNIVEYIVNVGTALIPVVGALLKITALSAWNTILGLIISVYLLIDKDVLKALSKKIIFGLFSKKSSEKILELGRRTNNIFGKFIVGKIIDSAIIGVLTFIILTIFNMPYTILISFIIGVTNIIPFFGPFFGAIPSAIIIMFVSPIDALWFILIVVIIQQLDGNLIGPKILGDSLGISAFWILFSLLIAGDLFGVPGMILGAPTFAVLYSIIKELIENKLKTKGLPTETKEYLD